MSNQQQKNPKKPLHKRIGHRINWYGRHFTKYLYERDTIFATIWVFLFIVVLGSIPINFYVLNPLKLALKDFDFNDMAYAKLGKGSSQELDKRIVIVNIGHADREQLARIIAKTAAMNPRVMGLDVTFSGPRDSYQDSLLREEIARHNNLVVANYIMPAKELEFDNGFFATVAKKKAYTNLFGEPNAERRSIRYYSVYQESHSKKYYSFGAALAREFDETAFAKLEKRHHENETINYTRRVEKYQVIEASQLLSDSMVLSSSIAGKIALLGYINTDPSDLEDKLYTPMNKQFVGKFTPDMNGVVIHANFISMVLDHNYIKKFPSWVNWLIAILICWLHMSFFVRYYLENHIWFHLIAKLAQVISAIFFAALGIQLYSRFNIKLDMKMSLIVIIMAVDVIYFYEAFAVWMHKKFHYRTVFHQPHH
jgi:CHASE2 domain-containing sensor protein